MPLSYEDDVSAILVGIGSRLLTLYPPGHALPSHYRLAFDGQADVGDESMPIMATLGLHGVPSDDVCALPSSLAFLSCNLCKQSCRRLAGRTVSQALAWGFYRNVFERVYLDLIPCSRARFLEDQ